MKKNKFYITTTLPYVNADPHVGFALELIQADALARYHKLLGNEVVFNMGVDEHGVKIYRKALEQGKEPQAYVDEYAKRFAKLKDVLNISWTLFIRTTDAHHKTAAQEFWKRCLKNDTIYKKDYKIKYCVGCELEKTDSELEQGHCPIHLNLEIEEINEENYFFRFSKFQKPLLKFYDENPDFVLPEYRFREIKKFVEEGLQDFSISRLKSKMPWGVAIPDDGEQVMYVWFDALVNYISTLGWPDNVKVFDDFWPGTQIAGKDNLRQQSAIWQAMLMAADLSNSKQILIHGFVTADGQKMSKSLGNVVDPFEVAKKYGIDPLRYYLLREIPSGDDGDFSEKKLEARYNGDLANGLGNLVQRVVTMIEANLDGELIFDSKLVSGDEVLEKVLDDASYHAAIASFRLHDALGSIWEKVTLANVYVNDHKPWELAKDSPDEFLKIITALIAMLHHINWLLQPFLPDTSKKIVIMLGDDLLNKEVPNEYKFAIKKLDGGLFPRLP